MEELLARVRSLLRRHGEKKATVFEYRGIKLDLLAHTVTLHGSPVDFTGREFSLLELFMQNQGRVLTRTLITEKIWDSLDELDANLLDVYMRRLRNKLSTGTEQLFKTVRGVGYQMI
jgi:two-component system copper resistance phosphate regulon response regulator CusR/two-component system response regulator QseB